MATNIVQPANRSTILSKAMEISSLWLYLESKG